MFPRHANGDLDETNNRKEDERGEVHRVTVYLPVVQCLSHDVVFGRMVSAYLLLIDCNSPAGMTQLSLRRLFSWELSP
jgi:hypothetical protein